MSKRQLSEGNSPTSAMGGNDSNRKKQKGDSSPNTHGEEEGQDPVMALLLQMRKEGKDRDDETKTLLQENMEQTQKTLGEMDTRICQVAARQTRQEEVTVSAFTSFRQEIDKINARLDAGVMAGPASSIAQDPEAMHEANLLSMIEDAKSCATLINIDPEYLKDDDLTLDALLKCLTHHCYVLEGGRLERHITGVIKISGAQATHPVFKVTCDAPRVAQSLKDQSKKKRLHKEYRGPILVRNFPPAYSMAASQMRQTATLIYNSGALAAIEYEGTTLTLRGKARGPRGQWLIVEGGEFRPLSVGRSTPQENESAELVEARARFKALFDNSLTSQLAKSLVLFTEDDVENLGQCKRKLGAACSRGLIDCKVDPDQPESSIQRYTLGYETRRHALDAHEAFRAPETVSGAGRSQGDNLMIACPITLTPPPRPTKPAAADGLRR